MSCFNFVIHFTTFLRMPFDPSGPIKFTVLITFQFITIAYELYVIACVLSVAIGVFMFAMASTEEIQNAVHEFNNVVNDQATSQNQSYILQQLSTFIYAHSTVKQLRIYNELSNFK